MICPKCGLECEYLGRLKEDNRKVYACRKCDTAYAETEIPTSVFGPTPTEIKQFQEEHADAEPCPVCGFKFYVSIFGIKVAYEVVEDEGFCSICSARARTLQTTRKEKLMGYCSKCGGYIFKENPCPICGEPNWWVQRLTTTKETEEET